MVNNPIKYILKPLRKVYSLVYPEPFELRNKKMYAGKKYANKLIYKILMSDKPCMIGRFGSTELITLTNYLGVINKKDKKILKYIKGERLPWWWEKIALYQLGNNAGFFPTKTDMVTKFCELMIKDMKELDVLGSWLNAERFFNKELSDTKRVVLEDLEPFFASNPWTKALEGKKVLVMHPFAKTVESQYKKRDLLFDDNLLPRFELKTIRAIQTIAGTKSEFNNWFDALEFMKAQIDKVDFDICIIGAGAYGFPLAAHVKRMGKKSIHLGGVTQLLFGIKGSRWVDHPMHYYPYVNLFNEHWVFPNTSERPKDASKVENACYW